MIRDPYKAPFGLAGPAAWTVFELTMLEHAFICYCLEMYLLKAHPRHDPRRRSSTIWTRGD